MEVLLLYRSDKFIYRGLKAHCTTMSMGTNQCPRLLEETTYNLNTYTMTSVGQQKVKTTSKFSQKETEVMFTHSNRIKNRKKQKQIHYNCGKRGHYAKEYPKKNNYMDTTIGDDEHNSERMKGIFRQVVQPHLRKYWLGLQM